MIGSKYKFMKTTVVLFLLILVVSCKHEYEYRVTGTGPFDVTYQNSSGGTEQGTVNSGWTYTWSTSQEPSFMYISAQTNSNSPYAGVTVKIYKDDGELKKSSSSGAYCIATASK